MGLDVHKSPRGVPLCKSGPSPCAPDPRSGQFRRCGVCLTLFKKETKTEAKMGRWCFCGFYFGESIQKSVVFPHTLPKQNHRMVWVGRDLIHHLVPTPCHGQGPLPLAQCAPSPIQPGLEPCQRGGSHSSSGQPGPGPQPPHGEEFLPNISSKSRLFQSIMMLSMYRA